jgi:uncharacterized membrane protein
VSKHKPYVPPQVQPQPQQFTVPTSGIIVQTQAQISGPIPSPEILAGYEKILPGAADRLVQMAEREQRHQHELDKRNQTLRAIVTFSGQASAFLLGMTGTGGGIFLVLHDKSLTGLTTFLTSLGSLVAVYLYSRRRQQPGQQSQPPQAPH